MLSGTALRLGLASILLCAGLGYTTEARADEPEPLVRFDPDAVPPPGSQGRVLLYGTIVTAAFYGGAAGAGAIWSQDPGASDLFIPVVGPWLKIGQTQLCAEDTTGCSDVLQVVGAVLLALDGLGQAGGLALLVEGLFFSGAPPRATAPPTTSLRPRHFLTMEAGEFSFFPIPLVQTGSDLGIGLVGTF